MYSNYQSFNTSMGSPMMSSSVVMPRSSISNSSMDQDSRLIGGGFLGPFVLGGITGGLLAPSFYPRPYPPRPYPPRPYPPYPYYGPYYR